jgi:hypothetical protein
MHPERHVDQDDLGRSVEARRQGFRPAEPVQDPILLGDELGMCRFVFGLREGLPTGLPDDGVDLAIGQAALGGELPREHGLAAAGIADDENPRHGSPLP